MLGIVGQVASLAIQRSMAIAEFTMTALFRHRVKSDLKKVKEFQAESFDITMSAIAENSTPSSESNQISELQNKLLLNESEGSTRSKEIKDLGDRLTKLEQRRRRVRRKTQSRKESLRDQLNELNNLQSRNHYEAIKAKELSPSDSILLGSHLIESQMGGFNKSGNELTDMGNTYIDMSRRNQLVDFWTSEIDKVKSERERVIQKLSHESNASESELDAIDAEIVTDEAKIAESKTKDEIEREVKRTSIIEKISELKKKQLEKYELLQKRAKDAQDRAKVSSSTALSIPKVAYEVSVFSQLLETITKGAISSLTNKAIDATKESLDFYKKLASDIKTSVMEGLYSIPYVGDFIRKATNKVSDITHSTSDSVVTEGIDNLSQDLGILTETTFTSKSKDRQNYIVGRLSKATGASVESVKQLRNSVDFIDKLILSDEKFGNYPSNEKYLSDIKLRNKVQLNRLKDALGNYHTLGLIDQDEYNRFIEVMSNPQIKDVRFIRNFNRGIKSKIDKLGKESIQSDRYLIRNKPDVNFSGLRMGPIKAEHILSAYDAANDEAVELGLDPFDPLITSAVRPVEDGFSKGSTHQMGTALDLRLNPPNGRIKSNQDAVARSAILGRALQKVLRNAGILDKYRIVSHGDVKGDMAPHFHLEYIGDTTEDQFGDFVDPSIHLGRRRARENQQGHVRIKYPEPDAKIIDVNRLGNESVIDSNKEQVNDEPAPKVPKEQGDVPDPKLFNETAAKAIMAKLNSMEVNLSLVSAMSQTKVSSNPIYISSPRRTLI